MPPPPARRLDVYSPGSPPSSPHILRPATGDTAVAAPSSSSGSRSSNSNSNSNTNARGQVREWRKRRDERPSRWTDSKNDIATSSLSSSSASSSSSSSSSKLDLLVGAWWEDTEDDELDAFFKKVDTPEPGKTAADAVADSKQEGLKPRSEFSSRLSSLLDWPPTPASRAAAAAVADWVPVCRPSAAMTSHSGTDGAAPALRTEFGGDFAGTVPARCQAADEVTGSMVHKAQSPPPPVFPAKADAELHGVLFNFGPAPARYNETTRPVRKAGSPPPPLSPPTSSSSSPASSTPAKPAVADLLSIRKGVARLAACLEASATNVFDELDGVASESMDANSNGRALDGVPALDVRDVECDVSDDMLHAGFKEGGDFPGATMSGEEMNKETQAPLAPTRVSGGTEERPSPASAAKRKRDDGDSASHTIVEAPASNLGADDVVQGRASNIRDVVVNDEARKEAGGVVVDPTPVPKRARLDTPFDGWAQAMLDDAARAGLETGLGSWLRVVVARAVLVAPAGTLVASAAAALALTAAASAAGTLAALAMV
ncbi:hypothetical protein HK405_010317 [Cladochytrium tenue]|nr:hypothetical protein HK405_010317 [Cladochytrium tenue]